MPRRRSTPILILTGFLGTGKTSLLNHLLANNQGLKIGVLINDFGDINIDAMLVSAQTDTALELSNGCICCQVDDETVDDAISQLANRDRRLDYIIIEASGVADPRDLATTIRLKKSDYSHFDTLVTVVDSLNFEKNNQASPRALDNLAIADLVIVNKTDLVDPAKLKLVLKGVGLAAPKARILPAVHGRVDWRLLLDLDTKPSDQLKLAPAEADDHDHDHHHPNFQSVSFTTDRPFDPTKFEAWAGALKPNIFRTKGIIFFGLKGAEQKFIFQAVGSRFSLKLDEWREDETPTTKLVVIGLDFDPADIRRQLEDLVDAHPDAVTADTLMDIFQYR